MITRLYSKWQQIKQHRVSIGVAIFVLVVAIALICAGYWLGWTGFGGYNKVSIATEVTSIPPKVIKTEEYQPGKTLWDWLQLLIIPILLAIGGFWFNQLQTRKEEKTAEQQAKLEREISADNQRETALQSYIDTMSELLLEKNLRESAQNDEVRKIARTRTLTILPRLDNVRKKSVLQFLYESHLIDKDKPIVDLAEADLSKADLRGACLRGANLRNTNLVEADLREADLREIYLLGANLSGADLRGAYLRDAHLQTYVVLASLSGASRMEIRVSNPGLEGLSNPMEGSMSYTDLSGTDLRDADLWRADLDGAHLKGAILDGANLSDANLSNAYFKEASMNKVDLREAKVTIEQLKEAKSLKGTMMPDGSVHP